MRLRRCAQFGHIGCCDRSPAQHPIARYTASRDPLIRSFEPGEDWCQSFETGKAYDGPALAPPERRQVAWTRLVATTFCRSPTSREPVFVLTSKRKNLLELTSRRIRWPARNRWPCRGLPP